ncbi:MAG: hypothetical protein LBT27_06580 [Prevotellaceae bacterium]|jgi:hypothetical protein|nr:hypothetical protein [Prevotellaceae bacterium]
MFGIKHTKFDSMTYVLHFKNGKVKREGRGLSFYYFSLNSSIVAIPIGSNDLPFIFNESTFDYQSLTIQGQISYKINNPKMLADVLDFTISDDSKYKKNEIEKLNQRIINEAQTATAAFIHDIKLKDAIRSAKTVENMILKSLKSSAAIEILGVEILGANILAIKANPEMTRALETETREKLQQEADHAIYERRSFAVEQERKIKEEELNTDIAIEEKERQIKEEELNTEIAIEEKRKKIAEKKMETEILKAENDKKLREMKMTADIAVENQRTEFINQKTENDKKEAEIQGYAIEMALKPYKNMDWRAITALQNNTDPKFNLALAFRELAENAGKIGTLNIRPELLETILNDKNNSDNGDNKQ